MDFEPAILQSIEYLNSPAAFQSVELNPYWVKWDSPWWHMSVLFEMGLAHRIPKAIAEKMLAEIALTHIPYFFKEELPADREPFHDVPCPCALGNMYQILSAVGVAVDQSLPWARNWFLRYQMPDGSLSCDEEAYHAGEDTGSIVGTIAPLEAILLTQEKLTPDEIKFVDQGAQFLIKRKLHLGSSSTHNAEERDDEADWLRLCFPRFYFYDVLRGLSFLKKWANLRNQTIPAEAIAFVETHLHQISDAAGKLRIERHSFEGTRTRLPNGQLTGWPVGDASRFPLLDEVSEIGEVSPFLTHEWRQARR